MTTFTLVLQPNGKALLVTKEHLAQDQVEMLKNAWNAWKSGHQDVLFISGTDVILVEDVELDLEDNPMGDDNKPKKTLADDEGKIDVGIKKGEVDDAAEGAGLKDPDKKSVEDPTLMENK